MCQAAGEKLIYFCLRNGGELINREFVLKADGHNLTLNPPPGRASSRTECCPLLSERPESRHGAGGRNTVPVGGLGQGPGG